MKVFHLKFNKESDGCWYIEFPGYPFAHHNLMMVAGADRLCDYVAQMEGHLDRAVVDIYDRTYEIPTAWLCPVTLLVLFRYPRKINLYLPKEK